MHSTGTLRGIAAMLLACAFFACMDALLKNLAGHYPPVQVMALRGLTALPLVCLYIAWRREAAGVFSRRLRWRLHLLRTALNMTMLVLFVHGLKTLGLAEAYTLTFIAPMLMVLIAVPMLGESVQPRHWIAIGLGFVGVVIALRPEQGAFLSVGALAILVAAVCYALSNMLGRLISRTESSAALVFWTTAGMAVGGGLLSAPQWVPIQAEHVGACGFGHQRLSGPDGYRRGLPSRPGRRHRPLRIQRPGLGACAGLGVLAGRARRMDAGRRGIDRCERTVAGAKRGAKICSAKEAGHLIRGEAGVRSRIGRTRSTAQGASVSLKIWLPLDAPT